MKVEHQASVGARRPRVGKTRLLLVLVATTAMFTGAACSPSDGSGSGGLDIPLGLVIPLDPITIKPIQNPSLVLGLPGIATCGVSYEMPSATVAGATIKVPSVHIAPGLTKVSVPVEVNIPKARVTLTGGHAGCTLFGLPVGAGVTTYLDVPLTVHIAAAEIDLNAWTLTLKQPSFTINAIGGGVTVNVLGLNVPLEGLLPLPGGVTVTLPNMSWSLTQFIGPRPW